MAGDWFSQQAQGSTVAVGDVLAGEAWDHALTLLELGCLVSFSKSRDGGALSCTVTHDGQWRREWFRNAEDLAVWLGHGVQAVSALAKGPPSGGSVQRLRGRSQAR